MNIDLLSTIGEASASHQQLLAAELASIAARIAGEDAGPEQDAVARARESLTTPAPIDRLADTFGLTPFERDLLLLCAGVELDGGLAARCASATASAGGAYPTFGLALAVLDQPDWSALTPVRPLRLWRMIEVRDAHALTTSRLAIDERVLHYLAGINYLDPRLRPLLRSRPEPEAMAASHTHVVDAAVQRLQQPRGETTLVQLVGDDRTGQQDVAREIATRLGLHLLVMQASDIPGAAHETDALALLWHREAALLEAALLVVIDDDDAGGQAAARWVDRAGGVAFVAARRPLAVQRPDVRWTVDRPGSSEQRQLWTAALGSAAAHCNGSLEKVAAQFRLSAGTILRTARSVQHRLDDEAPETLWHACRDAVRGGLDALAQRLEPAADWDDLVLPDTHLATLSQIAAHVRRRLTVYDDWGFAARNGRGLGISALFSGESGTGKTLAAEVLACELGLDLYRIDLAAAVSKYIGETEKNLGRVFDAAEDSGAMLLFDEADALFGRRSEIRESRDRYANLEVSYLLQRMEAYRGLAILTTNFDSALDPAFQRRLRFCVQFPFPDAALREQIWRRIFPVAAPLDNVDPGRLARLNVAGGSIRNIALHAAFLAAEAGTAISMSHLLRAARSEAAKRDRPFSDAETRGWV